MPRTAAPDTTIALLRDPYRFISRTCALLQSDVFETRIQLQRTICMRGRDAAELICDPGRFVRQGAAPVRIEKTLFGQGGVQGLDGAAHRRRKAMFMTIASPDRVADLVARVRDELVAAARAWGWRRQVALYPAVQRVLTRAVCSWAGVPLAEAEIGERTADLAALFDRAAALGPPHWRARWARRRCERWAADLVSEVRSGRIKAQPHEALFAVSWHRDGEAVLPARVAAVELLNVLRPTVAVSVFVLFVAHAIHEHPAHRQRLAADPAFRRAFVEEVRRFYPFFPAIAARVSRDFEWRGYVFPRGTRALLDLYGTDHDSRAWEEPRSFRPERFIGREAGRFGSIPQGPGDAHVHHRCPGERIAVELMELAAGFLAGEIDYSLPPQDLELDWSRVPAVPRSRIILSRVMGRASSAAARRSPRRAAGPSLA